MSNDTILSILFLALLAMAFLTGALMGAMRRDTEWRVFLADKESALDKHWETAIK